MEEENNMNEMKKKMNMGASVVIVVLMLTMLFTPLTSAVPIQPFERTGTTTANTVVTAWIDGVQYGSNTSDASGNFVIDVSGDDVDTTTIKEGGLNGDVITYMIGDSFAAETDVFISGSNITGDLTVDTTQPDMLKIDRIVTQPNDGNANQYLYIYNPTTAAVDLSTYQLEKDDSQYVSSVVALSGTVAAGDFAYVELTSTYFNTGGDEVKLNFTTTGKIVDRVEFGTQSIIPDNTIMGDAVAPGLGQEIYRSPVGQDTNDCSVDFVVGTATDRIAPTSSVDALPTYETSTTFTVTATASDDNTSGNATGVASVTLYWDTVDSIPYGNSVAMTYVSGDNVTGSSWTYDFTGTDGTTYYFYTVATDVAGNVEADPAAYDATTTIDATAPVSSADALPTYESSTTFTVSATASDVGSGLAGVTLYWSTSATPIPYTSSAAMTYAGGTSWTYSFTGTDGSTYYFYTIATDNATNVEADPAAYDATTTIDTSLPTSSVDALPAYETALTFTVTATATDATSGVASVTLYWDTVDSIPYTNSVAMTYVSGTTWSYSFTAPADGTYYFYSVATDNASNVEADPAAYDATTIVDTTAPTVISTTPVDGAVDVATAAGTYSIQFSETMDTAAAVTVTTTLPGATWSWSADGLWYNATYTALTSNTLYTVDLTGGGFVDLAGNALSGDITFNFTTVAYTATATGPTGSGGLDVTITYTYTGTPAAVTIWYSNDSNATWVQAGVDTTVDGSFAFTVPAAGTYYWFANATDDVAPASGDAAEAGPYDASAATAVQWPLYNQNNLVTFTTDITALAWTASTLAADIETQLGFATGTVESISRYDPTGQGWITATPGPFGWTNDFSLVNGEGYMIFITAGTIATPPAYYTPQGTPLSTAVTVNLYNQGTLIGVPIFSTLTTASTLASDIETQLGLASGTVESISRYDPTGQGWITATPGPFGWTNDFTLEQYEGYMVFITAGSIATPPAAYTPS